MLNSFLIKHKSRINTLVLLIVLITCSYFIYGLSVNRKSENYLRQQNNSLLLQNKYLERCFKYRLLVDGNKVPLIPEKGIVIYLSGKICPSCVDQLLHILKMSGEEKNTLVLANSVSKLDFIIRYNDINLTEFEFLLDTTGFIEPQNEILVFKCKSSEVKSILEFRPEEKDIFKKYFNIFFKKI